MATTRRETDTAGVSANGASDGGAATPAVAPETLLDYYRQMVEVRLFEEAATRGFRQGKVGGYLHVYIGQEALARGFLDAFKAGDKTITAYRDHAHVLFQGGDPKATMAELYGKGTGLVKGKGGSMHLFDVKNGMWGGYGIVGAHIPLGVGMAYAEAYRETGNVVQLYLGDGAIHNGYFHESANLAGLWGKSGMCPCLFIIENNQYGMGTSVERATANTNLGSKFDSYAIEWEKVDAMNLEAVIAVAHKAVDYVRETGRPYGVEAMTYRLGPHGAADFLEQYRSKDEVREARKRDPIGLLEQRLLDLGVTDEESLEKIRAHGKELADEAVRFAEESPEPDLSELTTDVYAPGNDQGTL